MKTSLICLALAFAGAVNANELDSAEVAAGQQTPKHTTVIRVDNQTKEVEVLHLKTLLAPGQKIENAKFDKVAVNTEIAGIKFDASNEMEATSSTSSWGFAARGPLGGGIAVGGRGGLGYGRGGYGGYGYGYGAGGYAYGNQAYSTYGTGYGYDSGYYDPSYYNRGYYSVNNGCYQNSGCGYGGGYGGCNNGCGNNYYASYRIGGYGYVAQPYYAYANANYSYYYCGW